MCAICENMNNVLQDFVLKSFIFNCIKSVVFVQVKLLGDVCNDEQQHLWQTCTDSQRESKPSYLLILQLTKQQSSHVQAAKPQNIPFKQLQTWHFALFVPLLSVSSVLDKQLSRKVISTQTDTTALHFPYLLLRQQLPQLVGKVKWPLQAADSKSKAYGHTEALIELADDVKADR